MRRHRLCRCHTPVLRAQQTGTLHFERLGLVVCSGSRLKIEIGDCQFALLTTKLLGSGFHWKSEDVSHSIKEHARNHWVTCRCSCASVVGVFCTQVRIDQSCLRKHRFTGRSRTNHSAHAALIGVIACWRLGMRNCSRPGPVKRDALKTLQVC